jgi:ADP-heptose:LPS heptosyltransferase
VDIEAARRLDRYAGVPLCFLGTALTKLFAFFLPERDAEGPKNILFIELSEMGSAVLADPALNKAKRTLGGDLFFAIFRKNAASLGLLKTVRKENIFLMPDSGILPVLAGGLKFLLWARKRRIDTVIDLELFSRFTALLTGFSGAARRVGFHAFCEEGLYRGDFLTHRVAYNPHLHIAKNFIALVNALSCGKSETPYSKSFIGDEEISLGKAVIDENAKKAVHDKIKEAYPAFDRDKQKIILFNTNSSELVPVRRWPRQNYIALAAMILQQYPDVVILLTGDPSESKGNEAIAEAVKSDRCVNFAGRTSVADLPVLYSLSAFMLTNDSGPAHFASVTDMPAFVFFGPESPEVYGPLGRATPIYAGLACSPCVSAANHRKTACHDNVCLQNITRGQVFKILKPALDKLK